MKKGEDIAVLLLEKGFDIEQALEICADDLELYMDILGTALEEGNRKLPIIKESIEIKDYNRYHIEVHALKNAMRAIGAMELSAMAMEQEMAAKKKDYKKIEEGYVHIINRYGEVLELLSEILKGE